MVDYLEIRSTRLSILDEYYALKADADANHASELKAAMDIQRCFRGSVDRSILKNKSRCASSIQLMFRGFISAVQLERLMSARQQCEQLAFYNYMSREIQRTFRGFYSRKYTHDFYSRKRYINKVIDQGNHLKLQMTAHMERQLEDAYKLEIEKQRTEFDRVTTGLHHLVSTKTQPGVYNSPYLLDQNITSFGIPIEETLIEQSKRVAKQRVGTLRKRSFAPSTNQSDRNTPIRTS